MKAVVEPLESRDLGAAADFLFDYRQQARPRAYWLERFAFWWDNNPAFRSTMTRGWVLRAGSQIVGFLGRIPRFYWIGDGEMLGFASTTWAVDPRYREESLTLFLTMVAASRDHLLWATTLGATTEAIVQGLGYQIAPYPHAQRIDLLFASPALRVGAFTHWLRRQMSRHWRWPFAVASSIEIGRLSEAGPAFDELWLRTRYQASTTRRRTRADVGWSCFGRKGHEKTLLAAHKNGRLLGYAASARASRGPEVMLEGLDIWWDWSEPETPVALLWGMVREARRQGLHGASILAYPGLELASQTWKHRLVNPLPHPNRILVPTALRGAFGADKCWFTQGEGDTGC